MSFPACLTWSTGRKAKSQIFLSFLFFGKKKFQRVNYFLLLTLCSVPSAGFAHVCR